jgi:hypothetical protein
MTGEKRSAIVETDPKIPPNENNPDAASTPPPLQGPVPPVIGVPPTLESSRQPAAARNLVAQLLSLCLALFLGDAVVSLADATLTLFFNIQLLSWLRGLVFFFAMLMALVIYVLMGLTPMVPKRWFLPVTLFNPIGGLVLIPFTIYGYDWIPQVDWGMSLCQVILALGVLHWARGGMTIRWPLVEASQLGPRAFSWQNLFLFVGANVLLVPPAVAVYLGVCAAVAVNHFTEGFMALRPGGLTVQARKYVRNDGQTIELFPMSHVADAAFYQRVSASFPTNSVILMEGVTDDKNLLTNRISYKRMATSLGLAEQHEKFAPSRGRMVRADVDVDQFAPSTIGVLNLAMLVHTQGVNLKTLLALVQSPEPPDIQAQLLNDLITKRNHHLLEEIHGWLSQSANIVVPWGALHMPGIARELQKDGFHLAGTEEFVVIHFGFGGKAGTDGKAQ